ncbi:DUF4874 domain-containing protein [Bacteroides sp. 519]|uniref:DUF4874 domain-containing protein n=1 Tax=Bacteroides sp. 519 TaxID=2302937 RepID=UPI0013D1F271|nr:DUF4874 domain-containing protein [Bacteroides sp. 519]NDV58714.1 DUF4874 domain-containing protein [Bacteroides sp. 519]
MKSLTLISLIFITLCSISCTGADSPVGPANAGPLRNPDRGFHLESNYFAENFTNPFNKKEIFPKGFIGDREKQFDAEKEEITLLQLYIYLTEWVDKDISPEGLANIQTLFDALEENGYKAILRFAYNWQGLNTSGGESPQWITRHIEQLRPILTKNRGLIATIQTGFLGAWGEWHTTPMQKDMEGKSAVVNALLQAYPAPYSIQIRIPDHKNALTLNREEDRIRISYANDYFTAGEHSHAPGNDFIPGSNWYKQVLKESPWFFMSGEIPYDEDTEWGLPDLISTQTTLKILRDHHYSAFDITQNYTKNITSWKQIQITPEALRADKILFAPEYFLDEKGNPRERTFFDFVRDHLGYRLNLTSHPILSTKDDILTYEISLTNTGFAAPVNPRPVFLVFINNKNEVVKELQLEHVNPRNWQPFDNEAGNYNLLTHTMSGSISTGLSGKYKVGLWMPDNEKSLRYNSIYDIKWPENLYLSHWTDEDGKYFINLVGQVNF